MDQEYMNYINHLFKQLYIYYLENKCKQCHIPLRLLKLIKQMVSCFD